MTTPFRYLQVERRGSVEHVVLNRPDVRNAFNEDVIHELTAWSKTVRSDNGPRVAILSGAGKVFCAGADLAWMSRMVGYSREENVRDASEMARMFLALDTLPIPLIGRIHGAALGGGSGLACVCDIVVAEDQAMFGFTEVKLGILPAVIAPYAVARIGRAAARELFLTGARFSAERARQIGLAHSIVPAADLDREVDRYVRELVSSGPEAVAAAKAMIQQVWNHSPADVLSHTAETIATRRVSAEGQEGMKAFLEKRKATWVED